MPDVFYKGALIDVKKKYLLLIYLFFSLHSTLLFALNNQTTYSLSATSETELELDTSGQANITVGIDTEGLDHELQGDIPITFILEPEQATFEGGKKTLQWHRKQLYDGGEPLLDVHNDSIILIDFEVTEDISNKQLKIRVQRERDISKLGSIAAFIPQMLPFLIPGGVDWSGTNSTYYYFIYALNKWNYKVFEGDIIKLVRDMLSIQSFSQKKPFLSQCTADAIEGLLLFKMANYGEKSVLDQSQGIVKTKAETFRHFMMTRAIKKFLDCTSSTVAEILFELQTDPDTGWKQFREMNPDSIRGMSKVMVGLSFNTIAFEASDFLKQIREALQNYPEQQRADLQKDLDRSLVKAVQYTLQSGYEDFFKGQLKEYGYDEFYAVPMATGVGVLEIFWRLYTLSNQQYSPEDRQHKHQMNSLMKRAEAMTLSLTKMSRLPSLSGEQLLAIGIAAPALFNAAILVISKASPLLNGAYDGLMIGMLTYFITPTLQDYGAWAFSKIQKPILDYLNSGANSWSKYWLADDIRYRVSIVID